MRRMAAPALFGGYSSEGGFFIWPGSVLVTVVLVLLFMRRRG